VRLGDQELLRKLAAWETGGLPVSTLYLDVDGRRYPRRSEYVTRMDAMLGEPSAAPDKGDREAFASFGRDCGRIRAFVAEEFDRSGRVRGMALFSCSGAGLWEDVALPQPLRDRFVVGPRPHLLPLEALLEQAETFCTAVVDREKARVVVSRLGEAEEISRVLDDVPGQHDQGGWSQPRYQRHIEDHVQRHLKHVGDALLRLQQDRGFDHLVLGGPEEVVAALERELHDYVRRTILGRASLAMTASVDEVLDQAMELERHLEERREQGAVEQLAAEVARGSGRAATGMGDTLAALEAGRVETLVVNDIFRADGVRCTSCGHMDLDGERCAVCGSAVERVPDLVEEAVESALRQRCRVETITNGAPLEALGGIGALLRF
jgi:peptide chain release factor subunit 1